MLTSCETSDKDKPHSSTPEAPDSQTLPDANLAEDTRTVTGLEAEGGHSASVSSGALEQLSPISDSIAPAVGEPEIYRGTGMLARPLLRPNSGVEISRNGDVTLNFANAEIQEVADVVLGQTLTVNYIIDPKVKGQVTARTSQPIPRSMVIPALENILALSGAALTRTDGIYKVVTLKDAAAGLTGPIFDPNHAQHARGFGIHIIPVKFASAATPGP